MPTKKAGFGISTNLSILEKEKSEASRLMASVMRRVSAAGRNSSTYNLSRQNKGRRSMGGGRERSIGLVHRFCAPSVIVTDGHRSP